MPDPNPNLDIFSDLLDGIDVLSQLAKDEKSFTALYTAFRAADAPGFQKLLAQLNLGLRCTRVCEFIRSKECYFVCTALCGPPVVIDKPDPRLIAETIVKITSSPELLKQLVAVYEKNDQDGFKKIATQFNLGVQCRLFCYWVCVIRLRLICRWVCSVETIPRPDFAGELQAAGLALRQLLANGPMFDQAIAASAAGDSDKLSAAISGAGIVELCYLVCEWLCSWRCVLATTTLCGPLLTAAAPVQIHEAFTFATAAAQAGQNTALLRNVADAIAAGNPATYQRLITELKLQAYCIQWTHWVCGLRCTRFCKVVCPPIFNHPWFTHVGDFGILADINPGTGLTNKLQAGHGGPNFGFAGCMKLRGFCPKFDPAHPAEGMAYRFLFQQAGSAAATPITGGFVCEVLVGTRYALWNGNPFSLQSVRIRGTGATSPTPPVGPPSPTPPDHYVVPDAQGWVTVDPMALDDGYNGWLMGFSSGVAFAGGDPAPGVLAGAVVPMASQKNGINAAIIFEATRASKIASPPEYTNPLAKIHINNWNEVNLIDLQEFIGPGSCSPLSTDLHINYTTDHELLADWFLDMVTAATVTPAPTFASGTGPRGAAGTDFHNITTWPTCSYLIRLHTRKSITDGLVDDSDKWNFKTFCIGKKS